MIYMKELMENSNIAMFIFRIMINNYIPFEHQLLTSADV